MKDDGLDNLFAALASADRRRMLGLIRETPGLSIADLSEHFPFSKVATLKHVRALEEVGLLVAKQDGRRRRLYFNVMPIREVYERWTDEYSAMWADFVGDLKDRLERRGQAARKVEKRA